MTGLERISAVFNREKVDRPPTLPILHTGVAHCLGVPLGKFYNSADVMANTIIEGHRRFGYDGVVLTQGVSAEPEALGAKVEQPENGAPVLKEHLLSDFHRLAELRKIDPTTVGRIPLFVSALSKVMAEIGDSVFVVAILRGPLLMASQLRGVEQILMDLIDEPELAGEILDFTASISLRLGEHIRSTGVHALVLGEATCSPNFISPAYYRQFVQPRHKWLVSELKAAGWERIGFHICGGTLPIIEDVISTGADFMDIDYQVPAEEALKIANGRIVLRGNVDPVSVFRYGDPASVKSQTEALRRVVEGSPWILSSGCDIPPGTPEENIQAFVEGSRA